MSYTPTTWNTGDTITASAMNKIENGIADIGESYDGVVYIYHDSNSSHDYETVILSGTFANLASKLEDKVVPTVLFNIWDELNGFRGVALGFLYGYDLTPSVPYATFHAFQAYGRNAQGMLSGGGLTYIVWNATDEVTL